METNSNNHDFAEELRLLAAELDRRDVYLPGVADSIEYVLHGLRDRIAWQRSKKQ